MIERDDHVEEVLEQLSILSPTKTEHPMPASQALFQLRGRLDSQPRRNEGRLQHLFKRRFSVAFMASLVILAVALAIPGVRAAASDFLGLFRVQKFAPISVSPEQLALLEQVAGSGFYPGEIEMIQEPGEPREAASLSEAEEIIGSSARSVSALEEPDSIYVIDGGSARLIVDVDGARAILRAAGADPRLVPDSLDGAAVNVTVYPGISQNWNDGTILLQSASPLVEYPEDVDVVALGEALLQFLGMDRRQANRLARSIDWTNTLLLPIPENIATFDEVSIDGVSGLLLGSIDGEQSALLWEKDGTVLVLSGGDRDRLIYIADSLR